MGQLLFWVDAAVALLVFSAVVEAHAARSGKPRRRWADILGFAFQILMWAALIVLLAKADSRFGVFRPLLIGFVTTGVLALLGEPVVLLAARRRVEGPDGSSTAAAARWPRGVLWAILSLVIIHMGFTFWCLDQDLKRDIEAIRDEASRIARILSPQPIPDDVNAAVLYAQVRERLDAMDDPDGSTWIARVDEWSGEGDGEFDPTNAGMLAFLDARAAELKLLHEAGRRPASNFGVAYDPPSFDMDLDWIRPVRHMHRLLALSSRVNALRGRMDAAMEDVGALFAMADRLSGEPLLFGCVVACAIQARAMNALGHVLAEGMPDTEALNRIRLSRAVSYAHSIAASLYFEDAIILTGFVDLATVGREESWAVEVVCRLEPRALVFYPMLLKTDLRHYRRAIRQRQQLATRPWYESHRQFEQLESSPRKGLFMFFMPTFSRAVSLAAHADASHRVALVSLEMLRYHHRHGGYPETLEALLADGADLPVGLTVDPFTGEPLKIGRNEDGRVVVYSVGKDLADDGGTPPIDGLDKDADIVLMLPASQR